MDLKLIKAILYSPPEITTYYFMKSYRACESYFNRIVFIGLRLKGIQYSQAEKIIRTTFMPIRDSLRKGLSLIDEQKGKKIIQQEAVQNSFNLFLGFSAPYRNLVSHGVLTEISDQRTLELLIELNIKMLKEIEHEIGKTFNLSILDEPQKWGARKSKKVFTENEINELKLGHDAREPISIGEAERLYKEINWSH